MALGKKRGPKPTQIDWKIVDNLLKMQCTGEEIAAALDISYDTLARACERDNGTKFAERSSEKRIAGNVSVRRSLWKAAVGERQPMLLRHMAYNVLGHSDRSSKEIHGQVTVVFDATDSEL